ncbi:hypothetical protein [Kribbella sp. NPDC051770]|uniref:hypothetical protein n=1 Tax=Kribbella sp. NPDC051770 TaxID=3155413 RepID=UPI00342A33B1
MSTPNEGLQPWTPGDAADAARKLSALNPTQQQALGRVIQAAEAIGPIINNVGRAIRVVRNTMTRLSQLAQRLTRTDRALTPPEQTQSQGGRHRAESSGLSLPTREAVTQARDTALGLARDATMATVRATGRGLAAAGRGLAATGRWAWSKGREGLSAAGQYAEVQANRADQWLDQKLQPIADKIDEKLAPIDAWADKTYEAGAAWASENYNKVSTAVNHQISKGAARASAVLAGLAANRMDPTARGQLTSPDQKLQKRETLLAQKAAEYFTAPESQQPAKAAELAAFVQAAYANQQSGPQQGAPANRDVEASQAMSAALTGIAPPGNRAEGAEQGNQSPDQPGTGRHRAQPGQAAKDPGKEV